MPRRIVDQFRRARRDPTLAVLEGFHPVKHAWRFGANVLKVVTTDETQVLALASDLAPDIRGALSDMLEVVPPKIFKQLAPVAPRTGVIAVARRPEASASEILSAGGTTPVVVLENPRHLGNIGASVRAAAAAGAAGLVVVGDQDPWTPASIRGAAGLHFAIPVARSDAFCPGSRPVIGIHPNGDPMEESAIPPGAALVFGSERDGLSPKVLGSAERLVSISMEPGVSSLNLAVSVAVVLYAHKLGC